ncbi:hypothetical protein ZIOFF_026416 [Zingiber officinale]|uniref:Protein kinase domain-containing protein n=1 Tax=Zingiber officinale TaxID=94328 RepID=A0A8J5L7E7_ZINOF|nr:hypothetical protein ZIOFF_026416 [Zingiber officinale]
MPSTRSCPCLNTHLSPLKKISLSRTDSLLQPELDLLFVLPKVRPTLWRADLVVVLSVVGEISNCVGSSDLAKDFCFCKPFEQFWIFLVEVVCLIDDPGNLGKRIPKEELSRIVSGTDKNELRKKPEYVAQKSTEATRKDAGNGNIASQTSTEATTRDAGNGNIEARNFTFRELAAATKNFRSECLLGEGGFGRVYKGHLENLGQVVAVKQLDRNGFQGNKEFIVEVMMLSLLHHENLVKLIGYCADGAQRLLVYEYMSLGSLEDHLLGNITVKVAYFIPLPNIVVVMIQFTLFTDISPEQKSLNWYTRMKIAYHAAQGLEYLHEEANPPVIYRDLKSSNILLDKDFNAKLSDFGLAKLDPMGDEIHVSSKVMGTYGYCAPEYARTGELTVKADVYSFGVVLLELITGRSAINTLKPTSEQNLVSWAMPKFKDQKRFKELVDPLLNEDYPANGLSQAVAVAALCLQEEALSRPFMADVVTALHVLVDTPRV